MCTLYKNASDKMANVSFSINNNYTLENLNKNYFLELINNSATSIFNG